VKFIQASIAGICGDRMQAEAAAMIVAALLLNEA
jgi:hypothetical protein